MSGANDRDGRPGTDPLRSVRKDLRQALPARFYREAAAVERDGLHVLTLDGRTARTPGRAPLAVRSPVLAAAIAAEWAGQSERIDPDTMPLTRIANSAIDGVSLRADEVAAEIVRYAGSDLLCYRAAEPEALARRQAAAWDPILHWAAQTLGVRLAVTAGIVFAVQLRASLDAIADALPADDPLRLAALHVATTLTGSAVLALALAADRLSPEAAWAAAHVDEDFQIEAWGADEEAMLRRAARWRDMSAAAFILAS